MQSIIKTSKNWATKSAIIVLSLSSLTSCNENKNQDVSMLGESKVTQSILHNVRLADGMPLNITISTRWDIDDKTLFLSQFENKHMYDSLVLMPRQKELANNISNQYQSVDSVFTSQRHAFINDLKKYITDNLGEENVSVQDVIIAHIEFPPAYVQAKERLALQEQELKRIRKQSVIDLENAESNRKNAIAQGAVNVEQARLNAELEKINAVTEGSRRKSMLARAETEKQVAEKRAESEARRQVLLAQADAEKQKLYASADLDKKSKLKDLEVKKQTELNLVALNTEQKRDQNAFNQKVKMAGLFDKNPAYASYLINKQLAESVEIAVLPSGGDASIFSGLLNQKMIPQK